MSHDDCYGSPVSGLSDFSFIYAKKIISFFEYTQDKRINMFMHIRLQFLPSAVKSTQVFISFCYLDIALRLHASANIFFALSHSSCSSL